MADSGSDGLAEATAEFAIQAVRWWRALCVRFLWSLTFGGVGVPAGEEAHYEYVMGRSGSSVTPENQGRAGRSILQLSWQKGGDLHLSCCLPRDQNYFKKARTTGDKGK